MIQITPGVKVVAGAFGKSIRGWGFGGVGGFGVMRGKWSWSGRLLDGGEACWGAPGLSFYRVLGWLWLALGCCFHSIAFWAGFGLPWGVGGWRRARVMVYFLCKVSFVASLFPPGLCFRRGVGRFGWGFGFQWDWFSGFRCTMGGGVYFGSC